MQPLSRKVFSNTINQTILRIIEVTIGVVTLGIITRYLGQSGFGDYTTVNALLQLFIVIIDFGLYLTLLREISANPQERTEEIANNVFTMRLVSTVLLIVLAVLAIMCTSYPLIIKLGMASLSMAYLFISLITTLTALFQKYLQMTKIAVINVINKLLLLGCVVYIQAINGGLQNIFIASSAVAGVSFGMMWYLLGTLPVPFKLRLRWDTAYWKTIIVKTWPLAVTTALNLIYFKTDTVILSIFRSSAEVGIYGASYRVLEIVATFPHMFMGLILPLLTAAWVARDYARLNRIWERAFTFFALITLPLVAGTFVVGTRVIVLIAGPDFAAAGSVLKLLMVATAFIFFGTLYTYIVLVIEQQRRIIKYFAATAVISLAGYLLTIPVFGYWGAAWMTVASELLIIIGAWMTMRPYVHLAIPWKTAGKIAAASAVMGLYAWVASTSLSLAPLIATSALVYAILILALRAIGIGELKSMIKPVS